MNNELMFSSKEISWNTPQELFLELNQIFNFDLDPCATAENAKCLKFFTKEDDGLKQSWKNHKVFMNPPYGREINKWMKKAFLSSKEGALVICLVPARTDTKWWHDYCTKGTIIFLKGRLKFNNHKNSAPFPSAIIIFSKIFNQS